MGSDFLLILLFVSSEQSYTERVAQPFTACYTLCPAGYRKIDDCGNQTYRCEKCSQNTFTAVENAKLECQRCGKCHYNEVEIKNCTLDSDVVCQCKSGHYNAGSLVERNCIPCKCERCQEPKIDLNNIQKCQPCQRVECLNDSECKRKCAPAPTTNTSTTSSTKDLTVAATNTTVVKPFTPVNYILWLFPRMIVVLVGLLFGLLLLCTWKHVEKPRRFPLLENQQSVELSAEAPKFREQLNNQGGSPTTLRFNIAEETPVMDRSHNPATAQHPTHMSPQPSNAKHKAVRQDEQSEHWPAIVLYAIIKGVPLRRWKEFLRLLSVDDQQLDRVELEASFGLGSMEKQYQMLRLWCQRSTASLDDVFSALHCMDLSGCAQLLQESLEKLQ